MTINLTFMNRLSTPFEHRVYTVFLGYLWTFPQVLKKKNI